MTMPGWFWFIYYVFFACTLVYGVHEWIRGDSISWFLLLGIVYILYWWTLFIRALARRQEPHF